MSRRLAICVLASMAIAPALAKATRHVSSAPFDGRWSILVVTEKGTCDVYRWNVGVGGGRITDVGDNIARASGRIDASGRVAVTLTRGADVLAATGALTGVSGAGRWTSASRGCAGRWEADRRG